MLNSVPCSRSKLASPGSSGRPSCAPLVSTVGNPCFGQPQRKRQMQEGVIGARTAESAGQHERGGAPCDCSVDGEFPVGHVLVRPETPRAERPSHSAAS